MADPLLRLAGAVKNYRTQCYVVHRPGKELATLHALRPGVQAGALEDLLGLLSGERQVQ
jgi:hypothetical protein